jgi:8-amino-7-oxononanoate synthase
MGHWKRWLTGGETIRLRGTEKLTQKNMMAESSEAMQWRGSGAPGRTMVREGRTYLFFSGYSYLGMSHVPAFKDLVREGIDQYGVLFPSSRISNTTLDVYAHLEHYLSQLTGRDATVTYASGYLACQALGDLLKSYGQVLVAPGTHPAIGVSPTIDLGSVTGVCLKSAAWPQAVLEHVERGPHDHFILVSNSVNPLTGTVDDFGWLQHLPRNKRFTVCIDDSHGIGWMGEQGEGIASTLPHLPQVEYILVYSLAKALHIPGGAISCPQDWAGRLRESPFYTGSTPMVPAFAHTLLQAGPLYEVQRVALMHNLSLMRGLVGGIDQLIPTDIPIFLIQGPQTAIYLEQNGVLISSFAYPDPHGTPINRLVISALHKESDLQRVVELLGANL